MGLETCHHLKILIDTRFGLDNTVTSGILNNEAGKDVALKIVCNRFHFTTCIYIFLFIALELITEAISKAGYTGKIQIAIDMAASEFYKYIK